MKSFVFREFEEKKELGISFSGQKKRACLILDILLKEKF